MSDTKRCTGPCGRELPATNEYFYRNASYADGMVKQCKDCRRGKRNEKKLIHRSQDPRMREIIRFGCEQDIAEQLNSLRGFIDQITSPDAQGGPSVVQKTADSVHILRQAVLNIEGSLERLAQNREDLTEV